MSGPLSFTTAAGILAMLALTAGCASSPPSRFYTLSPLPPSAPQSVTGEETVVAVVPVTIPLYLDRPQIVTRTSENELRLSEFERWAGSLREDLVNVMAENMAELLRGQGVTVLRAGVVGQRTTATRYRIAIDLIRFEADDKGPVTLRAQWVIAADEGAKAVFVGESTIQETVATPDDYAAVVAAMSRALATLSREITAAVTAKALAR